MTAPYRDIAVTDLMADPSQPRRTFNQDAIDQLAASINKLGVQQPIRVMWDDERKAWLILTGESRFRAARQAGLTHVPCLVVEQGLSEADRLADRLVENAVRSDLEPIDQAAGIARLKALKGCSSKALVEEYGFSPAAITRMESLLKLPPEVQAMVGHGPGQVPPSAAYELARLEDPLAQLELARLVAGRRLNRDGVAAEVRNRLAGKTAKARRAKRKSGKKGGELPLALDHGISLSLPAESSWDGLLAALDKLRARAGQLQASGKDISELSRLLAS